MALLEVRNLTKQFGALTACSDVSFDVERETIVGLIGPNGAGKTTLFNCIAGLYAPTSGSVALEGRDITGQPSWKIARLGVARTFQVVRPLKEMTVFENILVGAYMRHSETAKATEIATLHGALLPLLYRDHPRGAHHREQEAPRVAEKRYGQAHPPR